MISPSTMIFVFLYDRSPETGRERMINQKRTRPRTNGRPLYRALLFHCHCFLRCPESDKVPRRVFKVIVLLADELLRREDQLRQGMRGRRPWCRWCIRHFHAARYAPLDMRAVLAAALRNWPTTSS